MRNENDLLGCLVQQGISSDKYMEVGLLGYVVV